MERLLPWYIGGNARGTVVYVLWAKTVVFNALSLGVIAAGGTAGVVLVLRVLS